VFIQNYDLMGEGARNMADDFVELIRELKGSGCGVEVCTENSKPGSKSPD
jgi:hypothetical protein